MTGSSHSWKGVGHFWQGGLAPTVRPGEPDLGFQKGLSDWGAQNLDRFQPILEGGRPLLAGGSPLLLSSAGPGACLATSLVNRGALKRHLRLSGWSTRRNPGKPRFGGLVLGTPSRCAISGHPTAFDDAWRGPSRGGAWPSFYRQEGHLPGCLASPTRAGRSRGRPLLHETLLLGSRNALRTTEHAETQKIAVWRPRPGDSLKMSHFGPPDSIRRRVGRPLSREGEPATRAHSQC